MVDGAVTESFLSRYRMLLDAETAAFDDLEHAVEDGNRMQYEEDLANWITCAQERAQFLAEHRPTAALHQR